MGSEMCIRDRFNDLPEDFEEDEIDLSKIREEYVPSEENGEREEFAKAVSEIFGAMAEMNQEESETSDNEAGEKTEPETEQGTEEISQTIETVSDSVAQTTEKEEEVAEETAEDESVCENAEDISETDKTEEAEETTEETKEEPKKKKGFFGRLFG